MWCHIEWQVEKRMGSPFGTIRRSLRFLRPVHCGCISSINLFMHLDVGGIECILCAMKSGSHILEGQPSKIGNGASPSRFSDGGVNDMSANTDVSGSLYHPGKRKSDSLKEELISQFNDSDTDHRWYKNDGARCKSKERKVFQSTLPGDKMHSHNLGIKNKRLRIDSEDALELKVTWEEAQDLFCPPLTAVPSVVIIEGHEFEEYEEPPIFGKRTTFHKKRSRVPLSGSCEVSFEDLDKLPEQNIGKKRKKVSQSHADIGDSSGLDASTNAATLGEKMTTSSSINPTTKHPRHRLGCTCIVCIQPPSGTGPKHKSSCTCSVCITVKRRFKTLMTRRRKETDNAIKKYNSLNEQKDALSFERKESDVQSDFVNEFIWDTPVSVCKKGITNIHDYPGNEVELPSDLNLHASCKDSESVKEDYLLSKGRIDLNSQPGSEEEESLEIGLVKTVGLIDNVSLPLEMCIKQHELPSLIYPPQISNTLGFQQSSSEGRLEETSRVHNEDHITKEEFISNRTKTDSI
ncbi:B3 domain-containing protein Os07g0563300 isoform X2 [Cryptomeria japonica]|uniref:B3 domain-containing protein Os07g0563300 isoform X2 n=1 Tax=Cryptomeria japonica TaxID=3369 RepID=UPI0025AC8FCD|nr:B3 domain-containing protein Os07g0563300 isoform X2 [Cryptomeria japonica]